MVDMNNDHEYVNIPSTPAPGVIYCSNNKCGCLTHAWPKPDLPADASSAPWSALLKCWQSVYIIIHFSLLFLGIISPALPFVYKIIILSFVEAHLWLWLVSAKPFTKVWDWPPQANKWKGLSLPIIILQQQQSNMILKQFIDKKRYDTPT